MTKTSLSVRIGLEDPGPGRGVAQLRFSVSDQLAGIEASELIHEPLGPRNRDQTGLSKLLAVRTKTVWEFGSCDVSGRALALLCLTLGEDLNPRSGNSHTESKASATNPESQNHFLCLPFAEVRPAMLGDDSGGEVMVGEGL